MKHLHHNNYSKMFTARTLMLALAPNWRTPHATSFFFFFYIVFTGSKHFSNSSQDLSKLSNYQTCCFKAALETSVLNWWILSFFPPFAVSLWLAVFLRVPLMSRKLEIIQSANGFSITPHQSERRRNSHINLAIKCKTGVWINIVVGSINSQLCDDVNESRNLF